MRLALTIAYRYLFSKKSTNAINLISGITMLGMGVGAMALIIVLSVFNGFAGLVMSLYGAFQSDLRIESATGKVFQIDEATRERLAQLELVEAVSYTLEENSYIRYGDKEFIATMKGVDQDYARIGGIDSFIVYGDYTVLRNERPMAVIGAGIDQRLQVNVRNPDYMTMYTPKRLGRSSLVPEQNFNRLNITPAGVFAVQAEFDAKYVLVPLDFAQQLLQYNSQTIGAIEIKSSADSEVLIAELKDFLPEGLHYKNKLQQNEVLYRVLKIERWVIIAILIFILLIIAFNIIGSLSMLVMEKRQDIAILRALGADSALIQRIFLFEGSLSALIGGLSGVLLGLLICAAQKTFGIVQLGGPETQFVVDAYPVNVHLLDVLLTLSVVIVIALGASYYPAKKASEGQYNLRAN